MARRHSVVVTQHAEQDLDSIAEYVARQNPRAALELLLRLRDRISALAFFPERNQLRPQLGGGYRVSVVGSYLVVYRLEAETVVVMRVFQAARDYERLLDH